MSSSHDNLLETLTLESLLLTAHSEECSDVHLFVGKSPYFRKGGKLELTGFNLINEVIFWDWVETIFNDDEIKEIKGGKSAIKIVSYTFTNVSISAFMTLKGVGMSIRFLADKIPTMEDLGIPVSLKSICELSSGLIIVSGVIGSGKLTTLASLINEISKEKIQQVFIIEDAISFIYQDSPSLIQNLIIGKHIPNVEEGVKTALHNDSDIIVINYFGGRSTIDWAIKAAKYGNLVLLCMQSKNAIAVIQELYSFYGNQEQDFIRLSLAATLKAVLSQQLVPTLTGKYKRAVIFDLLLKNDAVTHALTNGNINQLSQIMKEGEDLGMLTMEKELQKLLAANRISEETFTETLKQITI